MATAQANTEVKKRGRPRSVERRDGTARVDADVLKKAGLVARDRGISIAEYLTESLRPLVDREFDKVVAKLAGKG